MQYADTPIEDAIEIIQSITCPDGKTKCGDDQTCCKWSGGGYWCCPTPEGVCYKDEPSCCPYGMTCCELGCCPKENGVCCNFGCCDPGYQCDEEHGSCIRRHVLPILMDLPKFNDIYPSIEKVSPFFMPSFYFCFI